MKRLFYITIISCVSLLYFSCSDTTDNTPVIVISPNSLHFQANTNDVIPFIIKIQSNVTLKEFKIFFKIDGSVNPFNTLLDTNLAGSKGFNYEYDYFVSLSQSAKILDFKFTLYDYNGNSWDLMRYADIQNNSVLLTETTGYTMYSKYSGKPDGFDIETGTPQFSSQANDSLLDIMDYDTISKDSLLGLAWTSKTGAKFVRFNGFDYANATNVTASNAYDAGTKLSIISNLTVGDIIITETMKGQKSTIAVIKITGIYDIQGTVNDRYEFNMKK